MEIILIILTGVIMSAVNAGFFILGYTFRDKKPDENSVTVDNKNSEAVKDLFNWLNYK